MADGSTRTPIQINVGLVYEIERLRRKLNFAEETIRRQGKWTSRLRAQCAWPGCMERRTNVGHCPRHIKSMLDELGAVKVAHSHAEYLAQLNAENVALMRENSDLKIKLLGREYRRSNNPFTARFEQQEPEIAASAGRSKVEHVTDGTVYALRVGGFVKIGWASDLAKRMRQYPPDSTLLATMPGTRADEHKIHKRLAVHRAQGREWFAMTPPVMEWVDSVAREHGRPEQPTWSAKPVKVPRPHSMAKPFAHTRFA